MLGRGGGPRHGLGHLALADQRVPGSKRDDAPVLCAAGCAARASGGACRCRRWPRCPRRAGSRTGRACARKLDARSGRSLITSPAAWTLDGLDILVVDAVAADVRIGQRDDLAAVARVGEDFLVAGQRGVEHHLADGLAGGAHGMADEMRAVCKCEQRGGQDGKQGTAPGFAGSARPAAGPRGHHDSATGLGASPSCWVSRIAAKLYPLGRCRRAAGGACPVVHRAAQTPRREIFNPERNSGELECAARVYPAVLNHSHGD